LSNRTTTLRMINNGGDQAGASLSFYGSLFRLRPFLCLILKVTA
jgi:hypothetical protein